ncbi:hypothetical protein BDR07DRAFT_1416770 [Suillus spraguei]|nr:hypothetical protein BDR07DRAFT_1416770 [Suillus spraguei]
MNILLFLQCLACFRALSSREYVSEQVEHFHRARWPRTCLLKPSLRMQLLHLPPQRQSQDFEGISDLASAEMQGRTCTQAKCSRMSAISPSISTPQG